MTRVVTAGETVAVLPGVRTTGAVTCGVIAGVS